MELRTEKPINMTKLKKTIDYKIEAILKYLEDDSNFVETVYGKDSLSARDTASVAEKSSIRESINTQASVDIGPIFLNINSSLTDIESGQGSKSDRVLSLKEYRSNTNLVSVEEESCETSQTPSKLQYFGTLEKKISEQSSSGSDSKQKIEQISVLRVFGAPLIESNTYEEEKTIEPFVIEERHRSNSKSNQKRSSHKLSYEKKNKENDCCSPTIEEKNNLKRTQFSNYSAARRLYESFTGVERESKVISLGMIERYKEEVEELYKKTRREGQDNNARARLLKRVQNLKIKTGEFINN